MNKLQKASRSSCFPVLLPVAQPFFDLQEHSVATDLLRDEFLEIEDSVVSPRYQVDRKL